MCKNIIYNINFKNYCVNRRATLTRIRRVSQVNNGTRPILNCIAPIWLNNEDNNLERWNPQHMF